MVPIVPDHAGQLGLILWLVHGDAFFAVYPILIGIRAGHVLPNQQAQLVAPVIPTGGLDLEVLAHAVKTMLLHRFDVPAQCLVGRRGVDAVRPESLVQRADLEDELAVEHRAGDALLVLAQRDLAHAKVAAHRIDDLVAGLQRHAQIIQMRRVGRPELGIRNRELEFLAGRAADLGDRFAAFARHHFHFAVAFDGQTQTASIHIRHHFQGCDVGFRHRLEPHGLPDAGGRRIHDWAGTQGLFATRLAAGIGRIEHLDLDFLRAIGFQRLGDVEAERVVSTPVAADFLAIDGDFRFPVHRAEVQQHTPAAPVFGNLETPAVCHAVGVLHHSRKRRLDRIRNQDFCLRAVAELDVPEPVEVQPFLPDHLRPGIFRQRVRRGNLLRPARHQWRLGWLPVGGVGWHGSGIQENQGRREDVEWFFYHRGFPLIRLHG